MVERLGVMVPLIVGESGEDDVASCGGAGEMGEEGRPWPTTASVRRSPMTACIVKYAVVGSRWVVGTVSGEGRQSGLRRITLFYF